MRLLTRITYGIFISLSITTAFTANYYVTTSGDNNNTGLSWNEPFSSVYKALQTAVSGDEIWVAEGFHEVDSLTIDEGIAVYGGFTGTETNRTERDFELNRTTLDGTYVNSHIFNSGTLDGFHLTGRYMGEEISPGINNNASGKIENCWIHDNYTEYNYGAIQNSGSIKSCYLYDNSTEGRGGAFSNRGTMDSCFIYDNHSKESGGAGYNSGTLINCVISRNTSETDIGGVYNSGTIMNCTVTGNISQNKYGGIHNHQDGIIKNSIISGNISEAGETNDLFNEGTVTYSCFSETDNSNGNIVGPALFKYTEGEPDSWDLHLKQGSTCIDAGINDNAPDKDIEGENRPQDTGIDMGAYECTPENLRALFSIEETHILPNTITSFYDGSYGSPTSWAWDFDNDGTIDSTDQNPSWAYTQGGQYSVSLTVSDGNSQDTIIKKNHVSVQSIWYVKSDGSDSAAGTSWSNSFQTIKKAIGASREGDHIWVTAETYRENSMIVIPDKISLYGGFAGTESTLDARNNDAKTIIDGQFDHTVLFNRGMCSQLTITNGFTSYLHGGSINYGVLENCRITSNRAELDSGGVYNARPGIIKNSRIDRNYAMKGGGITNLGTVINSIIDNNTFNAVDNYGTITNSTIRNNLTHYYSTIENEGTISNCRIYDNSTVTGQTGGVYNFGTVENCLIYNNSTNYGDGGGIFNGYWGMQRCDVESMIGVVKNCTIYGNTHGPGGAGIYCESSAVVNSIIWNNHDALGNVNNTNSPQNMKNCCFAEATEVNENISSDPMFVNINGESSTWDFHLQNNSPCIDSGDIANASDSDMEGNTRPLRNGNDMGAYEAPESAIYALFSTSKATEVSNTSIKFQDMSYGSPDQWKWDFNNDGIVDSTEQNPTWTFPSSGYHYISLAVANSSQNTEAQMARNIYISRTWHVSEDGSDLNTGLSWETPIQNINKTILEGGPNDSIWVQAGTYLLNRTFTVNKKVALYGGFAGTETSLTQRNITANPTILNGNESCLPLLNWGLVNGISVTGGSEGGIENKTDGIIEYCKIYGNYSEREEEGGGGIYNEGIIRNSMVYENESKGISDSEDGGSKGIGGGIYNKGIVENCLIFKNTAIDSAGGLTNIGTVINTTIYGNTARTGCGISCGRGKVINTIIWGNICSGSPSPEVEYNPYSEIIHCCFSEATEENGNFAKDPLFMNTEGDIDTWDFHLQAASPCIDRGTSDNTPSIDLDGIARPQGNGMDLGAYESMLSTTSVQRASWMCFQ